MPLYADDRTGQEDRTTLEQALRGYDPAFERILVDRITEAIALASLTTDGRVIALRTGEVLAALGTVIAATLALTPDSDVPSRLREMVEQLAKRIQRCGLGGPKASATSSAPRAGGMHERFVPPR